MAKAEQGPVCDVCKRPVRQDEDWIALDGGQIWCAGCWAKRFYDSVAMPAAPAGQAAPGSAELSSRPASSGAGGAASQTQAPAEEVPVELLLEPAVEKGRRVGGYAPLPPGQHVQAAESLAPKTSDPAIASLPPGQHVQAAKSLAPKTSGLAIASLVLALVGILCAGILTGSVAVVLGILALRAIGRNPNLKGRGLAVAGLITGIVDILGWVVLLILFFTSARQAGSPF